MTNVFANWIVIGVSGVTCGGKTTLANQLKDRLTPVYVFHQDKYFYPDDSPNHVKCEGLEHNNYDILSSLDMDKMYKDIISTMEGKDCSHYSCKEREEGRLEVKGKSFLIVEGFTVLNYAPIMNICNLRYYFVLEYAECLLRRSHRLYSPPDVAGYFDTCVWPEHLRYRAQVTHTALTTLTQTVLASRRGRILRHLRVARAPPIPRTGHTHRTRYTHTDCTRLQTWPDTSTPACGPSTSDTAHRSHTSHSLHSHRLYSPPDVAGYFDTCVWPEHLRYRAQVTHTALTTLTQTVLASRRGRILRHLRVARAPPIPRTGHTHRTHYTHTDCTRLQTWPDTSTPACGPSTSDTAHRSHTPHSLHSHRLYSPPDVAGYFDTCVWPEHLRYRAQVTHTALTTLTQTVLASRRGRILRHLRVARAPPIPRTGHTHRTHYTHTDCTRLQTWPDTSTPACGPSTSDTAHRSHTPHSLHSHRLYSPPDVAGYFDTCVWPEHLRYRAQVTHTALTTLTQTVLASRRGRILRHLRVARAPPIPRTGHTHRTHYTHTDCTRLQTWPDTSTPACGPSTSDTAHRSHTPHSLHSHRLYSPPDVSTGYVGISIQ
ncbi:Nicotinamide riboside kinase 1 [Papilio machaon]|uniref:Nicotinamide riboside kinase 1 n=1 Tax=Papilio machaon TaxID=76193 RepID=A0A0N1IQH2_PAPMA|nr:Nicotinamide riboside kinase 1 [Papilio machaon]